jgi:hypothetical protein
MNDIVRRLVDSAPAPTPALLAQLAVLLDTAPSGYTAETTATGKTWIRPSKAAALPRLTSADDAEGATA